MNNNSNNSSIRRNSFFEALMNSTASMVQQNGGQFYGIRPVEPPPSMNQVNSFAVPSAPPTTVTISTPDQPPTPFQVFDLGVFPDLSDYFNANHAANPSSRRNSSFALLQSLVPPSSDSNTFEQVNLDEDSQQQQINKLQRRPSVGITYLLAYDPETNPLPTNTDDQEPPSEDSPSDEENVSANEGEEGESDNFSLSTKKYKQPVSIQADNLGVGAWVSHSFYCQVDS